MDLHELSAGYALDALDPDERARFEEHLAGCERCREELRGFWRTTRSLAVAAGGPAPPPALRGRILDAARAERPAATAAPPPRPSWLERLLRPAPALAAVATMVALGLGLWAASLDGELDDLRAREAAERDAIAALSDPDARSIPLEGAEGRVVIGSTGTAALVLSGVQPAPEGMTYEIWVIEDGVSRPAGLFHTAHDHTVLTLTEPVPEDAIVAVTLETEGGVDAPTGEPLFHTPPV